MTYDGISLYEAIFVLFHWATFRYRLIWLSYLYILLPVISNHTKWKKPSQPFQLPLKKSPRWHPRRPPGAQWCLRWRAKSCQLYSRRGRKLHNWWPMRCMYHKRGWWRRDRWCFWNQRDSTTETNGTGLGKGMSRGNSSLNRSGLNSAGAMGWGYYYWYHWRT